MTFTVTIYPTPAAPTASNKESCYGFAVPDLVATGTGTIQWYVTQPTVVFTGSPFATGNTAIGTYNYLVTQTVNTCLSPNTLVSLTIHPIPAAPFAADTTICFGDNTPGLTANGSGDIKWYGNSSVTPPELFMGPTFNSPETNVGVYNYYITQSVNNCESLPYTVTLTINPVPVAPTASDSSSCFGQTVPNLYANGTGVIQWYTDIYTTPPPIIGATLNTGQTSSGTYTYYVTQLENGCESQPTAVTLTIIALPQPPQSSNVSICDGQPTPDLTATATGTINWYDNIILTPVIHTGSPFATGQDTVNVYTYYVTQTHLTTGCQSNPTTVTLTINPIPVVSAVTDIIACPSNPVNIGNFVSTPSGAIFNWTNSNANIGLATSGTGNIPQWTAPANLTNVDIVGTITVTPSLNGCPGLAVSFTVTIKPTPSVTALTNISVCPGTQINIPSFTSTPTGSTFAWTNSNTAIGLSANGSGDITSWNAPINNTNANIVGTISVTATLNGCTGSPTTFTVTIYPSPSVTTITNITACPGSAINIPTFASVPAGGTFAWVNSNTAIGLAASGIGNISTWSEIGRAHV